MKLDSRLLQVEQAEAQEFKVEVKPLKDILSASDLKACENMACVLINIPQADGSQQMFRANTFAKVPLNTEIIKSSTGQAVGMPVIAGGSF